MQNILAESEIYRLFSLTSPQAIYHPINLEALPAQSNFAEDKANQAYQNLLGRFRRWNKTQRFPGSPTGYKSKTQMEGILHCIYQELLLIMREGGTGSSRGIHVMQLNDLLWEHAGGLEPSHSSKPKKHIQDEAESKCSESSPFFVRSKIANLQLQQKKISYAQLQKHSKLPASLGKKASRRLRIYGPSKLTESMVRDQQGQKLFRNWLMKERCSQFHIDKISRWNRSKCKDGYQKITMSEYLDSRSPKLQKSSTVSHLTASMLRTN